MANHAVGHDNVDLAAATRLGIPVSNTPDVLTETTADLAWALLLAAGRRIVEADRFMRLGNYRLWGPQLLLGEDISPGGDGRRKTLGVIGFGRIGEAVARRARGFDMDVVAHHPSDPERVLASGLARPVDLAALLSRSRLRLAAHTVDGNHAAPDRRRRTASAMKPSAILVNTSRGAIVDEAALVVALREGQIAAAGLDVYEHEPAMAAGLAELPEYRAATPHRQRFAWHSRRDGADSGDERARDAPRGTRSALYQPTVYEGSAYAQRVRSAADGPAPRHDG